MPSELRPLGDFVTLVSGNTPSKANAAYWGGTTPWVSAKDMAEFWIEDAEDHITPLGVEVASRLVPVGTVLMLVRGMTLHKRVPICRVAKPSAFNQDVKAVLPKAGLSARFLPYLLVGNHDRLHERVDSAGHGTGRLNTEALLSLPVSVPNRVEQEGIADIGEAVDGRLRLLRQTNATLESIAQALFKSWFIDFDPVRAKAEGREPEGMDAATAALFPAEFEDSALGFIPKGWSATSLGQLLELAYGKALKATDRRNGSVPVYGSGGITGFHDAPLVQHGSIVVGRKGTVGSLYWEDRPFYPIDTTFYVRPRSAPLTYCFYVLQRLGLETMNTDAAVPGLNRENAYRLTLPHPTKDVLAEFDGVATPLRAAIRCNSERMNLLSALRDALLPRLISGTLRLPEAQAEAREEVAYAA